MTIYLPNSLYQALRAMKYKENKAMNVFIELAVEEYINNYLRGVNI